MVHTNVYSVPSVVVTVAICASSVKLFPAPPAPPSSWPGHVGWLNRGKCPFESGSTLVIVPAFWSPNATINSPDPAGVIETVVRLSPKSCDPVAVLEVSNGFDAAPATSIRMKSPPTLSAASVSVTLRFGDGVALALYHMSVVPPAPAPNGLPGTCVHTFDGLLAMPVTTPDSPPSLLPVGPPATMRFPDVGNWRLTMLPAVEVRWLCWMRTMRIPVGAVPCVPDANAMATVT